MNLHKQIEKSFPKIGKLFTYETLWEFWQTPPERLEEYNLELGAMIRLKLLRPKSALYKCFIQDGFSDKDQMSMEIIREFYKYLHRT